MNFYFEKVLSTFYYVSVFLLYPVSKICKSTYPHPYPPKMLLTAANTPFDNSASASPIAVHKNRRLAVATRVGSPPPVNSIMAPTIIIMEAMSRAITKIQLPIFSRIAINALALNVGTEVIARECP